MPLLVSALARWLALSPEFKVLRPVVVTHAVLVVDVLAGEKRAAKGRLHDEAVLKDIGLLGAGARKLSGFRIPDPDIATLVHAATLPCVGVLLPPKKELGVIGKGRADATRP